MVSSTILISSPVRPYNSYTSSSICRSVAVMLPYFVVEYFHYPMTFSLPLLGYKYFGHIVCIVLIVTIPVDKQHEVGIFLNPATITQIKKLRPLPVSKDGSRLVIDSAIPPGLCSGLPWRKPNGTVFCYNDLTHSHEPLPGFRFFTGYWAMARLPDGTIVLGGRRER